MQYINMMLTWMPSQIAALILAALGVVAVYIVAKIIKLILDVIPFI